jgi:hypothetical protein
MAGGGGGASVVATSPAFLLGGAAGAGKRRSLGGAPAVASGKGGENHAAAATEAGGGGAAASPRAGGAVAGARSGLSDVTNSPGLRGSPSMGAARKKHPAALARHASHASVLGLPPPPPPPQQQLPPQRVLPVADDAPEACGLSAAKQALRALELCVPWDKMDSAQIGEARQALANAEALVVRLGADLEQTRVTTQQSSAARQHAAADLESLRQQAQVKARSVPPRVPWAANDSRRDCQICRTSFTLFNRRHHCRKCGGLVDQKCSLNFVKLRELGYTEAVRVCDTCFRAPPPQQQQLPPPPPAPQQQQQQQLQQQPDRPRPPALSASLLAQVTARGAAGKSGSPRLHPAASEGANASAAAAQGTHSVAAKPRTVLDELRKSLVKRNSSPDVLQKRANEVDRIVEGAISAKKSQIAQDRFRHLQPRRGTAIAAMLHRGATTPTPPKVERANKESPLVLTDVPLDEMAPREAEVAPAGHLGSLKASAESSEHDDAELWA